MPSETATETPVHLMTPEEITQELTHLTTTHGFHRPSRSTIDPSRPWRNGPPSYDASDLAYFRGRTTNHPAGSLEDVVENAVKTWEMEATHFDFDDWTSVDPSAYSVCANGGRVFRGREAAERGNYTSLLAGVDAELYDAETETFESSHAKFRGAFPGGFPWEVLRVFSGPPEIAFSWRHWADFQGVYKGREGDGKQYDMYGWGVIAVDEALKVKDIRIFYKPEEWLKALEGRVEPEELERGESLVGNGCPFLKNGGK